ncbi:MULTISPECIES: hypothetical protein [unclassified Bradyrhizobium]|uniref:hypothetical protein n=1 Tax=unclassified Bradyrhizobium TaxID=2631580 RepID=UPI0028EC2D3E|nr:MULTISPECIES: hypothetical protein [unclassified Bradyrhizobium]
MTSIADAIGLVFLGSIGLLVSTSFGVALLRLMHHRQLANKITEKANAYLWLLNLGGGEYRRDHRHS